MALKRKGVRAQGAREDKARSRVQGTLVIWEGVGKQPDILDRLT